MVSLLFWFYRRKSLTNDKVTLGDTKVTLSNLVCTRADTLIIRRPLSLHMTTPCNRDKHLQSRFFSGKISNQYLFRNQSSLQKKLKQAAKCNTCIGRARSFKKNHKMKFSQKKNSHGLIASFRINVCDVMIVVTAKRPFHI